MDEQVCIEKGSKRYIIRLEIEEKSPYRNPTHNSLKSLINCMKNIKKGEWHAADDPSNFHPLIGFMHEIDENTCKYYSIAASTAFKDKDWKKASFRREFADKLNEEITKNEN